jgi:predicted nucleic acid-binding protein
MHLLDTDVLWALRGRAEVHGDEALFEWVSAQMPSTLFISVVTVMELENGTRLLERKDKPTAVAIRNWIGDRLRPAFEGRVLAIDDAVARRFAHLGYADFRDGILAATALEHGLVLATREVAGFRAGRVRTVNPWTYAPDADELDWRAASRSAPIWLKSLFVRG